MDRYDAFEGNERAHIIFIINTITLYYYFM